jgi:hypothetical protein
MSHTHKRFRLRKLNPVRWYRRRHRGEASPLWVMSATAPFEVPILCYFAVLGWFTLGSILVGQVRVTPGSVLATLPAWLVVLWSACFAVGSTIALAGRYLQRFPVESSGLALLGAAFFTYAIVVTYVNGFSAIFASGAYIALLTGCLVRIRVISFDQKARRVAADILHEELNGDAPR